MKTRNQFEKLLGLEQIAQMEKLNWFVFRETSQPLLFLSFISVIESQKTTVHEFTLEERLQNVDQLRL